MEYLGKSDPGGPWGTRDRGLAEALVVYEGSLCPGCSHPRHEAWDERNEGEYEAVTRTCMACRPRDLHTDTHKPGPGQYVLAVRIDERTARS